MQRRDFLKQGAAGAGALAALGAAASIGHGAEDDEESQRPAPQHKFKLKYAPHFGMFDNHAGRDRIDQLKFAADQGFTAWEDNGMKGNPPEVQEKLGQAMADLGMTMGVFVAHASFGEVTFAGRNKDVRDKVVEEIKDSVEVAKRCGAKWMTVVPDAYDQGVEWGYQTANCVELLRRCAEVLEPHELVMVLEPLNWWTNHPGLFLHKIPQAYEICRAVDSPSCKILFDIYHQQIQEGNLIPNMDKAWDEIGYFQCGDNPGRNEPGTGEINFRNVFKHIHSKGYEGIVGMEHGKSQGGKAGEQKVIDEYVAADDF